MRFIENMSVGRKLAVAFGVVLAAIAVMGVVVVTNLLALQRADHARNLEGEINQVLAVAEFRLSKQENSYRGYLLSQDPITPNGWICTAPSSRKRWRRCGQNCPPIAPRPSTRPSRPLTLVRQHRPGR